MPLLSIWNSNPETVAQFTIEQVVTTAGSGKLLDGSECSDELREYLSQVGSEKLAEYAEYCLITRFENNGKILQDVVNELGRRLDYQVENGRYQGSVNKVGNDGLWKSPEGHALVVEVKTTDAYSISVDTIAQYRKALLEQGQISDESSMLLVVGRYDTGQLEAQVRGSRHAWDMRLISIDSLVSLVNLKENTEDASTSSKIRSLLIPREYTRIDALIDVMFTAARDVESSIEGETPEVEERESTEHEKGTWVFTETKLIDEKRKNILRAVGDRESVKLVKKSRALHWSPDRKVGVACTVSKRYEGLTYLYWYAFHPEWREFLLNTERGFFALGCMDLEVAFVIPLEVIESKLDALNTTTRNDKTYWHIQIPPAKDGKYFIQCHRSGDHLDLTPFVVSLVAPALDVPAHIVA